jgi:hypothetical protein
VKRFVGKKVSRLSLALSFALPLAVLTPGFSSALTSVIPGQTNVVKSTCSSVLYLAARGSGEYGPGSLSGSMADASKVIGHRASGSPIIEMRKQWPKSQTKAEAATDPYGIGARVGAAWKELVTNLKASGYPGSVEVQSVDYPAIGAGLKNIILDISPVPGFPQPFFIGVDGGVKEVLAQLQYDAIKCPNQWIVLSGYSQGAMVMHRAMDLLLAQQGSQTDPIAARFVDAILIADGDQRSNDNTTRLGTAQESTRGVTQALRNLTDSPSPQVDFNPLLKSHIYSICITGDPICDWSHNKGWPKGTNIHSSYDKTDLPKIAADRVAQDIKLLTLRPCVANVSPGKGCSGSATTPTVGPTDQPTPVATTPSGVAHTYAIGDTGPAGGIIFITPSTPGNTIGKYFEASLASFTSPVAWCSDVPTLLGATGTSIGSGALNTAVLLARCGSTGAGNIAASFRGGGKSDWFLPSKDELNQLCQYASGQLQCVGGWSPDVELKAGFAKQYSYWSSSERAESGVNDVWAQYFGSGQTYDMPKIQINYVHPIRAFS